MSYPILVSEYRGDVLENVHHGVVCGINEDRDVILQKGDSDQYTYYRSTMKPFQAIPVFQSDAISQYQLTGEEAALFAASQRGEAYHEQALQSIMTKTGIAESSLVCHATYPVNEGAKEDCLWAHTPERKLYHNCSGKHLGFLLAAQQNGWDMSHYENPDHPLQQQIIQYVADFSEVPVEDLERAVDGCGAPVYAVPLYNMALSYLKLVCPDQVTDESARKATQQIGQTMNAHPRMIASHDFVCTALLQDPNIIAKGGAQGVYCFALREEKQSFALKVLSGSEAVWPLIVAGILEEIGYKNQATIDRLYQLSATDIKNDNGKIIGYKRVHIGHNERG